MQEITNSCNGIQATDKPSQFCDLYKTSPIVNQNKRREELLAEQKSRRENILDEARGLCTESGSNYASKHKNKNTKEFRNKIMLSEWLIDVPSDFDVSWWMKFCPEGHRNIVVAHKNSTKSYSKSGRFECKFKSILPGACGVNDNSGYKTTILDCIWHADTKSFYILDVLMWCDYNLVDYDAEFRFFWLQSKLAETPDLDKLSSTNEYAFHYVPHTDCDFIKLKNTLEKYPLYEYNIPAIDGLLFYHKEASYMAGKTPLVGWLKPYMVPEILKIPVATEYLAKRPGKYVNLAEHIEFSERKKKKLRKNIEMDTT